MKPELIPDWFDRSMLRKPLTSSQLNKLMMIDGITPYGWISRRERQNRPVVKQWRVGKPITSGNLWRPLDVIAAARADVVSITPPPELDGRMRVAEMINQIEALSAKHAVLCEDINRMELLHTVSKLAGSFAPQARRLATREEILAAAGPAPIPCGVYFLVKGAEVVYVGQSTNIVNRIMHHEHLFDEVAWVSVPPDHLDITESLYIHALMPRLNKVVPLSIEQLFEAARSPAPSKTRSEAAMKTLRSRIK